MIAAALFVTFGGIAPDWSTDCSLSGSVEHAHHADSGCRPSVGCGDEQSAHDRISIHQ